MAGKRSKAKKKDERFELRVASGDVHRWKFTAAFDGRSLSSWVRRVCNEAAAKARR